MTGIRIEGTKEDIEEALRRLNSVFCVNVSKDQYYPQKDKYGNITGGRFYYYIRAYCYSQDCTFDAMEAYKREVQELTEELGAAQETIARLRKELDRLQISPGSMVLGSKHR